ncbi:hypothetical protein, partial [Paenibacillus nanensis]|uniref:hypothetical protein n=1 Tax=Paenibacillus nanensis TaxID=393251 RepID=UPI00197F292C
NFIVERPPDGLFEAFDLVCNSILPEALVFVQTPKYSFYRNSIGDFSSMNYRADCVPEAAPFSFSYGAS